MQHLPLAASAGGPGGGDDPAGIDGAIADGADIATAPPRAPVGAPCVSTVRRQLLARFATMLAIGACYLIR
eukprot:1055825-Pyramimonas_sp.AAC.1